MTAAGRGLAGRPAVMLNIDLADVHIGRDFTIVVPPPTESQPTEFRSGLTGLLERVSSIWLDQVLCELVPGGVVHQLGPSTVEARRREVADGSAGTDLATERTLSHIFEGVDRALLILGDPGSGKTVSMLGLLTSLVERAHQDADAPVPVVLKLAPWRPDSDMTEWLAGEINAMYRVPRRHARRWIRERRILPMLDGLDEVEVGSQRACVEAINELINVGMSGIVVTCRSAAYRALDRPLNVNAAYELGPFSPEQVLAAVDGSEEHDTLSWLLRQDPDLLETARTPLMLRMLMQTYRGMTETDLARDGLAGSLRRHEHVVDAYAQRAFDRAEEAEIQPAFDEDAVISALSTLAGMMHRHSQGIFLIERLQPSWISDPRWTTIYLLATRLGGGLIIGLVLGVLFEVGLTLAGGGVLPSGPEAVSRLLLGISIGLGGGVIVAIIDVLRYRLGSSDLDSVSAVVTAAAYLLTFTGLAVLVFEVTLDAPSLTYGLATGLSVGLLYWVFFGLPARGGLQSDIRMAETLVMDRRAAVRNLRRGALAGLLFGGSVEALLGMAEPTDLATRIIAMLLVGSAGALTGGVVGGAVGGLRRGYVRSRSRPNEGFRLTLRNMWLAGGVVAAAGIAVFTPLLWLGIGGIWGLALGLTAGIGAGAMAALGVGGMDALRHLVLRIVLRLSGRLPSPLVVFLNYSAEIGFLQRAGGAYLFIHNVVQEHFAAFEDASAPLDQNRISMPAAGAIRPSLAKNRSSFE